MAVHLYLSICSPLTAASVCLLVTVPCRELSPSPSPLMTHLLQTTLWVSAGILQSFLVIILGHYGNIYPHVKAKIIKITPLKLSQTKYCCRGERLDLCHKILQIYDLILLNRF